MEAWLLILLSLSISTSILILFRLTKKKSSRLPPGPIAVPFLGNLQWLRWSVSFNYSKPLLRELHLKYGPIITLHIGSKPLVFISDHRLTHKLLIEQAAAFSNRPSPLPATRNITFSAYGPLWRLLRRNLTSGTIHPYRVKSYADSRDWVLGVAINHLHTQSQSSDDGSVVPKDSFQLALFSLVLLMCFGEKLDEKTVTEIAQAQRNFLLYVKNLDIFGYFPTLSKYFFGHRLRTAKELGQKQMEQSLAMIKAGRERKKRQQDTEEWFVGSYLDSLLTMKLPEEGGRSLTDDEMAILCVEFIFVCTNTTWTAFQWTMAELVKNEEVQKKLLREIEELAKGKVIEEEELQKMPYLRAVIFEVLRRHPPAHFTLPHSTSMEEVEFEGYVIPKDVPINFMVAEMAHDEKVWEDPFEFRPERFLGVGDGDSEEAVDITGSREVKMMPFGVGRRICPGIWLALFHLQYFVANLVKEFEWKTVEGHEVDLSETPEFTMVMKYPLRAHLIPRNRSKK